MDDRSNQKSNLSSNLLQMKFMKKSALRLEKEKSKEEIQHIIDDEHWVLDIPQVKKPESNYEMEPSYRICENLVFGRMSFKGFNPEVEKLMQLQNNELALEEAERKERDNSLNDDEMVERYQTLIGTISNKFKTKRHHPAEDVEVDEDNVANKKLKRQFKKPVDD